MSKIALDLDGVVYEYDSAARYMLRTYRGCTGLDNPSTSWDSIKDTVTEHDWHWLQEIAPTLGLFRYGHIVKGAIVGVRLLAERGHSISIVTHRPRVAVRDTIAFLDYANLPIDGVHILSDGQSKTAIDADVLIDDKVDNIIEWVRTGRSAILFDQPWNQKAAVRRAEDWEGVLFHVRTLGPSGRFGSGAAGTPDHLRTDVEGSNQRWR